MGRSNPGYLQKVILKNPPPTGGGFCLGTGYLLFTKQSLLHKEARRSRSWKRRAKQCYILFISLSYHRDRHYHTVAIPKGNGEFRELSVPDDFLKAIQKSIATNLLDYEPVSHFAMAYCLGKSTISNAAVHTGKPVLLKLDIRQFFDHVIYPIVKDRVFPAERYSESNRVLLTMLCMYKDALPQGAPTSPAISNIIMRDFDDTVGRWCHERDIAYTRYCDDLSFSGNFEPNDVIGFVKKELGRMGFFLNEKKTVVARTGQKQQVTGIVVNGKLNAPSEYRRKLRQELFFCRKYGLQEHMSRKGISMPTDCYLRQLLGRVNYVLQISPKNQEVLEYQHWIKKQMRNEGDYYERAES